MGAGMDIPAMPPAVAGAAEATWAWAPPVRAKAAATEAHRAIIQRLVIS
jgi:hypothetical protein